MPYNCLHAFHFTFCERKGGNDIIVFSFSVLCYRPFKIFLYNRLEIENPTWFLGSALHTALGIAAPHPVVRAAIVPHREPSPKSRRKTREREPSLQGNKPACWLARKHCNTLTRAGDGGRAKGGQLMIVARSSQWQRRNRGDT